MRLSKPIAACLTAILFGGLVCSAATVALGNPSHADPRALLPIHLTKLNAPVYEQAVKNYQEANVILDKLTTLRNRNRMDSASPKDFERAFEHLGFLKYQARRLYLSGETTGYDLDLRYRKMIDVYTELSSAWKSTNSYGPISQRAENSLSKYQRSYQRESKLLAKLIADGKTQEAWDQLLKAQFDTLAEAHALMIDAPNEFDLDVANRELQARVEVLWRQQAEAALVATRDATMPDMNKIVADLGAAAKKVKTNGNATIGGELFSGPDLATHFHVEWRKAHIAVIRAAALEYARSGLEERNGASPNLPMLQSYQQFCGQMVSGLAELVSAHARQCLASDAAKLHQQYLAVLGPLAAELGADSRLDSLQTALDDFGRKSATLGREITSYRNATSELLRWKERVAAAEAKKAVSQQQTLLSQLLAASLASSTNLYAPGREKLAELHVCADEMAAKISKQLLNKPTRIVAGAKASPQASTMIGRYYGRTYCILSDANAMIGPQRNQLFADLMVSDDHPPQTLDAAAAVAATNLCMFEQAGGEVSGFFLESAVTRMATLPEAAHPFLGLNPIDLGPASKLNWLRQMAVRCDLRTTWIASRYFFASSQ